MRWLFSDLIVVGDAWDAKILALYAPSEADTFSSQGHELLKDLDVVCFPKIDELDVES